MNIALKNTGKSKFRGLVDRITNPVSGIRPAGVFGFLLVIAVYYLYKNVQIGNI